MSAQSISNKVTLWVHEDKYPEDLLVNPDVFPNAVVGQLLAIHQSDKPMLERPRVILQITSLKPIKMPQHQISVSKHVADQFNLQNRRECLVVTVLPEQAAVEFIQISFKDQYLGRSDMWRVHQILVGTAVYQGKKISYAGMRAQVKHLYIGGKEVECGLITDKTRTVFRSDSAKFHVFLQMSREMWQFDDDGELYFEKAVQGFLPELFERWGNLGTNHVITIVLFSRLFYPIPKPSWWSRSVPAFTSVTRPPLSALTASLKGTNSTTPTPIPTPTIAIQEITEDRSWAEGLGWDAHGRCYQDFYKVIADCENRTEWSSLLTSLKQDGLTYQQKLFEASSVRGPSNELVFATANSAAFEGNFLEASNLALNIFEKAYANRDLFRTGLSVLVITPGTGLFEVDQELLKLSKHRTIDNGIGCDVLCLSRPPLHTVPLFKSQTDDEQARYSLPHWIDISFYNRSPLDVERPFRLSRFVPSCKMNAIQMGVVECDVNSIELNLPTSKTDLTLPVNTSSSAENPSSPPPQRKISFSSFSFTALDDDVKQDVNDTKNYDRKVFATEDRKPLFSKPSPKPPKPREEDQLLDVQRTSSSNSLAQPRKISSPANPTPRRGTDGLKPSNSTHSLKIKTLNDQSKAFSIGADDDPPEERAGIAIPQPRERQAQSQEPSALVGSLPYSSSFARTSNQYGTSPMPITAWDLDLGTNKRANVKYKQGRKDVKQRINPFNPPKNQPRLSSYRRRWNHAFPTSASTMTGVEIHRIKWFSLCTPACLPLTTDYFPPAEELTIYEENQYTIIVPAKSNYQRIDQLLHELISQRLAQGFQLVFTAPSHQSTATPSPSKTMKDHSSSSSTIAVGSASLPNPVVLSIGNHFHVITLRNDNLEIKRYIRRDKAATKPLKYPFKVWPRQQNGFQSRSATFQHSSLQSYMWNKLDNLICGVLTESELPVLKSWHIRLVLIPINPLPKNLKVQLLALPANEHLDEEEVRIAGLRKFVEILDKSQRNEDKRPIKVDYITSTVSSLASNDSVKNLRIDRRNSTASSISSFSINLTKESPVSAIAAALQDPDNGVSIRDRIWHLRMYRRCFIGSDAVEWFLKNIKGIENRDESLAFGNDLLQKGVFLHVRKSHQFLDGHFFYHFTESYVTEKKVGDTFGDMSGGMRKWFKRARTSIPSLPSINTDTRSIASTSTAGSSSNFSSITSPSDRLSLELSQAIIVDVDPAKKSDRPEWAVLHCDTFYNVSNCYHIQLHWLVATGRLIDEMIQTWARRAQQCGFLLVDAPYTQANAQQNDAPFQSLIQISLAIVPPSTSGLHLKQEVDDIPTTFFEEELLKKFNFVLDLEADDRIGAATYSYSRAPVLNTQFIHSTGAALVQILPAGKGFIWENNRLFTSKMVNADVDGMRSEFTAFCSSADELTRFWSEARLKVVSDDAMDELSDDDDKDEKPPKVEPQEIAHLDDEVKQEQEQEQEQEQSEVTTEENKENDNNDTSEHENDHEEESSETPPETTQTSPTAVADAAVVSLLQNTDVVMYYSTLQGAEEWRYWQHYE